MITIFQMKQLGRYELLEALINLSDEDDSSLQAELSDGLQYGKPMKYKRFNLLDYIISEQVEV